MDFPWLIFVDLGAISAALLLATLLRARIGFFQRYLIPNALTAGFLLLVFYNYVAPLLGLSSERLGALAYHLLNISFVAMALRKPEGKSSRTGRRAFSMAVGLLSQYGIQATFGLVITFVLMFTLLPELFPTFGFLVPLGFSAGPGQAYAIGVGWEQFGFFGAGTVGLTFAAIGFLWACFGGVVLINVGIRRGWIDRAHAQTATKQARVGVYPKGAKLPVGARLTTESEAIDSMTYNVGMVLLVYLLTFLALQGITALLSFAGSAGRDLAVSLWGIAFIFCALVAMPFRKLLSKLDIYYTLDNAMLTRVSGLSVDLMVAGALGAISLVVVTQFWLPILIMSTIAGVLAVVLVPWMGSRMFPDHHFGRTMIIYGAATGTLATGLALLRVLDPDFETPVATDYMYASAIVFVLAIPLILMINLPAYGHQSGNPVYYWISLGICLAYIVFSLVSYLLLSRKRATRRMSQLWVRERRGQDNREAV